ncbi:hypothetical protein [Flavobacterium sp.]|uniref:hypothetical protein n=1 Tax=Flavobacterium sp. TaxID=239 RepID=UPI0039E3F273
MKKLITLGIALLATVNHAVAETTLVKGVDANLSTVAAVKAQQFENLLTEQTPAEIGKFSPVEDKTILNPETVIVLPAEKPIEEVIAQDKKITESIITDEGYIFFYFEIPTEEIIVQDNKIIDSEASAEIQPLYLERTIEDIIAEDNAIIEGTVPTQMMCLDFDKINKNSIVAEN